MWWRLLLVLTIRLSRIGKKKKPFYRVVVIERTRPRDGRVVENVGTYDPLKKPAEIKLDAERIRHCSESVRNPATPCAASSACRRSRNPSEIRISCASPASRGLFFHGPARSRARGGKG